MKTYQNKTFGFEVDLPDDWLPPVGLEQSAPYSQGSIVFGCPAREAFNLQIAVVTPAQASLERVETDLARFVEDHGYLALTLGRLTVAGVDHAWARYYMWSDAWTKKYVVMLGDTEYTFTATCFDQKWLLQQEPIWDAVVASLRPPAALEPKSPPGETKAETDDNYQQALLQFALANTYATRQAGDRAENLQRAVRCYQQALRYLSLQAHPQDWAMAHNNLGEAYRHLSLIQDQAQYQAQAIIHYRHALQIDRTLIDDDLWAAIRNNLGIVLAKTDQADSHEQAIALCRQALEVYTPYAFPDSWAMTQNNLGQAYRKRVYDSRAANLEQAIEHYRQALTVQSGQPSRLDWAGTHSNLVLAFMGRLAGPRAENLDQAIIHGRQALAVYASETHPEERARIENLLAVASQEKDRPAAARAAASPAASPPLLFYPQFYEDESRRHPGEKCQLQLIDAVILAPPSPPHLTLVYQWPAQLPAEVGARLSRRAVAYLAGAIYDAANVVRLACRLSDISNGRRPAWLIANSRMPISLILSDVDDSERVCLLTIGPLMTMLTGPSYDAFLLSRLSDAFCGAYREIVV